MIYSLPRQNRCYTVERIDSAGGREGHGEDVDSGG